jgi:hypothetical protein
LGQTVETAKNEWQDREVGILSDFEGKDEDLIFYLSVGNFGFPFKVINSSSPPPEGKIRFCQIINF